ncbi:MAG: hypothetical protein RL653_621 [Pseudomonadota bacterium]|jgi:hypothetical protein
MLRDDQVLRYSRQLLLREVGGAGQQAWLDAGIRVAGGGRALEVAVAYLAGAGLRVDAPQAFWSACTGWLHGTTLADLNPDASRDEPGPRTWISLVEAPHRGRLPEAAAHCVLGGTPEGGSVWLTRCRACAEADLASSGTLEPGALALQVGAKAARLLQHWLLSQGTPGARLVVRPDGRSGPEPTAPCGHAG